MKPLKVKVESGKELLINWNNNEETKITLNRLRRFCPCATCLAEKEKQSKTYIPILTGDTVKISNIQVIGNYAIGITWKDGHNTGIYEFPFLINLGKQN